LKKRFIRIYPIYWLVTAFLIVVYFISPTPEQSYKGDIKTIFGSLALLPQNHYIVSVAWTLTYEVLFYLIFAFSYFKHPKYLFYTLLTWTTTILFCVLLNFKSDSIVIATLINPVILNFVLGCLIAYLYNSYSRLRYSSFLFWFSLFLFFLMWTLFFNFRISDSNAFTGKIDRLYLFGIPAALIIFSVLYIPIKVPKLLVYLGDASYSIYLIHGTVLSLLIKLLLKLNLSELFNNFGGAIVLFTTTTLISCLFYSLIEKNLLKRLNRSYSNNQLIKPI
jgi:peptidoglycan/LPS O-acetylase OafA/YrhL